MLLFLRCECATKSIKCSSKLQILLPFVVPGGNLLMAKSERASSSNQLQGDLLNTCLCLNQQIAFVGANCTYVRELPIHVGCIRRPTFKCLQMVATLKFNYHLRARSLISIFIYHRNANSISD